MMEKLMRLTILPLFLLISIPGIPAQKPDPGKITIKSVVDHLKNGEIREASNSSLLLLENDPKSPEAHALFALALINGGEYEKAEEELNLAVSLGGESPDTNLGFGRLAFAEGDLEEAIRRLYKATDSHLRIMASDLLAASLSAVNRHREAKEVMVRASKEIGGLTEAENVYIKSRIEIYDGCQGLKLYRIPDEFRSTTLDFTNSDGHILAPMAVNGLDIGNVHLDTGGSGGLTVSAKSVENLDLKMIGRVTGMNVAKELTADVAIVDEIRIGDLVIKNVPVNIYHGAGNFHGGSSGNLGKEVLQRLNMTIDYKNSSLTFFHPRATDLQAGLVDKNVASEKIPFHRDKFIIVQASINGRKPEPFILDTGAGITVFHSEYYSESIASPSKQGEPPTLDKPKPFTLDSLRIGGREYEHVMSLAMDLTQIYKLAQDDYPGIIGNPIFQNSRLHFNFADSTLVIEELR